MCQNVFGQIFIKKKVFSVAQKKELFCVLPFICKKSLQLRSRLVKSIQQNLKFCSLNDIFLPEQQNIWEFLI